MCLPVKEIHFERPISHIAVTYKHNFHLHIPLSFYQLAWITTPRASQTKHLIHIKTFCRYILILRNNLPFIRYINQQSLPCSILHIHTGYLALRTQLLIFAPKIENNEIQICCIISPAPLLTLHCRTSLPILFITPLTPCV